jgi:carboxypeptidase PM20D1
MNITAYFEEHNMHFDAVYDEGGVVIEGAIASVKTPLAVIGVAEKGYNNIRVTVTSKGGHSSMPPKHTALGDLAQIAVNIEKHPMNPILTPIVKDLLTNICNEMGFAVKMAVRNLWLFKPILFKVLGASPATNAMIRTTFAATMAKGSDAPNIMPQTTEMIVNVRVLPGNTPEEALDHVKSLAQGIDAKVEPILKEEASPISDLSGKGYAHLLNAIGDIYPNAIPTAYLVLGGTDARKYYNVSNAIYRFMPAQITNEEQGTMHAANEYISIENYKRMIRLLREADYGLRRVIADWQFQSMYERDRKRSLFVYSSTQNISRQNIFGALNLTIVGSRSDIPKSLRKRQGAELSQILKSRAVVILHQKIKIGCCFFGHHNICCSW